jgi:cytochrome c553
MRRLLKWIGIGLGTLLGVAGVAVLALYYLAETRLTRPYTIPAETVPIPAQAEAGRRDWPLTLISFCEDCHGQNLGGQMMGDDNIGRLVAPNITRGQGGVVGLYTDEDWVRTLRHGVSPNGRPLLVMPSQIFASLSDEDLGRIIAQVKSVPPVDNTTPPSELRLVGRIMLAAGLFPPDTIPAEIIAHDARRPPVPEPGVTAEYGRYLAHVCTVCHGEDLAGGVLEGEGRNLTPAGDLATWSEADFIRTLRTGVTPAGEQLDPELFPYQDLGQMTDDELKALWLYLKSLPPVETEPAQ